MATRHTYGNLTDKQIKSLAETFSSDAMESVATGYMGISRGTVEKLKEEHSLLDTCTDQTVETKNKEEFNRHIIELWISEYSGPDAIGVSIVFEHTA